MIFKYYRQKMAEKLAFFTQNNAKLCKNLNIIFFEKSTYFFHENCDNIDPRDMAVFRPEPLAFVTARQLNARVFQMIFVWILLVKRTFFLIFRIQSYDRGLQRKRRKSLQYRQCLLPSAFCGIVVVNYKDVCKIVSRTHFSGMLASKYYLHFFLLSDDEVQFGGLPANGQHPEHRVQAEKGHESDQRKPGRQQHVHPRHGSGRRPLRPQFRQRGVCAYINLALLQGL
jgi:hypothetical protein